MEFGLGGHSGTSTRAARICARGCFYPICADPRKTVIRAPKSLFWPGINSARMIARMTKTDHRYWSSAIDVSPYSGQAYVARADARMTLSL